MTRAEWSRRKGRSSSKIRKSLRFAVYLRDGFACVWCRQPAPPAMTGRGLVLDHVVPQSAGGGHGADNLITSCVRCNAQRRDVPAADFAWWRSTADPRGDHHVDARRIRDRVRRAVRKPVNRGAGRLLAALAQKKS